MSRNKNKNTQKVAKSTKAMDGWRKVVKTADENKKTKNTKKQVIRLLKTSLENKQTPIELKIAIAAYFQKYKVKSELENNLPTNATKIIIGSQALCKPLR